MNGKCVSVILEKSKRSRYQIMFKVQGQLFNYDCILHTALKRTENDFSVLQRLWRWRTSDDVKLIFCLIM